MDIKFFALQVQIICNRFAGKIRPVVVIPVMLCSLGSPALADVLPEACRKAFVEAGAVPFTDSCAQDSAQFRTTLGNYGCGSKAEIEEYCSSLPRYEDEDGPTGGDEGGEGGEGGEGPTGGGDGGDGPTGDDGGEGPTGGEDLAGGDGPASDDGGDGPAGDEDLAGGDDNPAVGGNDDPAGGGNDDPAGGGDDSSTGGAGDAIVDDTNDESNSLPTYGDDSSTDGEGDATADGTNDESHDLPTYDEGQEPEYIIGGDNEGDADADADADADETADESTTLGTYEESSGGDECVDLDLINWSSGVDFLLGSGLGAIYAASGAVITAGGLIAAKVHAENTGDHSELMDIVSSMVGFGLFKDEFQTFGDYMTLMNGGTPGCG